MYNEQQKKRFLDGISELSGIKVRAVFKRIEAYEKENDLDCSCFSAQEALAFFKQYNTSAINTLRNAKSALSVYADWCKEQNLLPDGINHYTEISAGNLVDCLSDKKLEESYLSDRSVQRIVDQLENAFEKVAVLLAYEGVLFANYNDCYTISCSDIDGNHLTVGGEVHEISYKLRACMEEAEEADRYYLRQGDGNIKEMPFRSDWPPIFKQLYNAVREYDTMDLRRHYFERLFRRIREYTGERFITVKKLNDSGRINELKRLMEAEGATDARECFMKHKNELDAKYGTILEVGRFFAVHKD